MSDAVETARIRRIAIALGSESLDAGALERIARLAAGMRAEMAGLFVEDISLLHLAALPFAAEFCRFTQRHRPLQGAELERQLRIQAAAAQRALAAAAQQAGVKWSFRVTRGPVATLLLEAAAEMDLLALGGSRRLVPGTGDLGLVAAAAAQRALRAEAADRPVVAICDETTSGHRSLEVARDLADADTRALTVVLIAPDEVAGARLRRQVAQRVGARPVRYRQAADWTVDALLDLVRSEKAATLVLPASPPVLQPAVFNRLREGLRCPALLVR